MGGKPIMAIAILGWPVNKLGPDIAQKVLEGGRDSCIKAGIPLAGGHSIDSPEPIFGLAVNGLVDIVNLKQNNTARAGDLLLLTKPLGTGLLSTAQKRGHLTPEHEAMLIKQLTTLNKVGEALGHVQAVHAMTDVTGFGLLGHCIEMAEGSNLSATLYYNKIPFMTGVPDYLALKTVPDATSRNWSSYGAKVGFGPGINVMEAFNILPDPQTNGGLLIAVQPEALSSVQEIFKSFNLDNHLEPIGFLEAYNNKHVNII
jgi:selenide,water dikinase